MLKAKVDLKLVDGDVTYYLDGSTYADFKLPEGGEWSVYTRTDGSQYLRNKTTLEDHAVFEPEAVPEDNRPEEPEEPEGDILDKYLKLVAEKEQERREQAEKEMSFRDWQHAMYLMENDVHPNVYQGETSELPQTMKDYRGKEYKIGAYNPSENSGKASEQEHYKGLVQPIQIMQKVMTQMELLGFFKGNVIKYSCRAGKKAGESEEKDMTKCKQYYDWIEELEATGKITL